MSDDTTRSLDLIVSGPEEASGFIDQVTDYSSRERTEGFYCCSLGSFNAMLHKFELNESGIVFSVITHVEVADVDEHVRSVAERSPAPFLWF